MQVCRDNAATLPVVENKTVQALIEKFMKTQLPGLEVWTAGRGTRSNKWHWLNGHELQQTRTYMYRILTSIGFFFFGSLPCYTGLQVQCCHLSRVLGSGSILQLAVTPFFIILYSYMILSLLPPSILPPSLCCKDTKCRRNICMIGIIIVL